MPKVTINRENSDPTLKRLFAYPIMIEFLIKGFVPEAWAEDLDFSSLDRVNVKHTTEDLRSRENDIIWKVKFKGQTLYIILILEFQTNIDRFMAVRLLTYAGLAYQDLIIEKGKRLIKKLPPIFPLVLYIGEPLWNCPKTLKDCLSPAIPSGLIKYQPDIEYMVLDVARIKSNEYTLKNNLVAMLIELENVRQASDQKVILDQLGCALSGAQFNSLRRDFLLYIKRAMKLEQRFPKAKFNNLEEVSNMLSNRMDGWEQNWLQEGLQKGRQEGRQEQQLSFIIAKLQRKYQKIPKRLTQYLEKLTAEEIQPWVDRIINEQPLEVLIDKIMNEQEIEMALD
jgi:hypothetical protein